jgi:NTE family protein
MTNKHDNDNELFAADLVSVIHSSRIFSTVDRAACEKLLPRLEKIILLQGNILFEQGDPSDSLYILIDGQLVSMLLTPEGKQKIVGTIEKGETVGELGAISNQPRSSTIRATANCKLLKLSRNEFDEFSKENPGFITRVIDLIITRSQNTLKLMSQKKLYQHIAIIQGTENTNLDKFLQKLKENFKTSNRYILLDSPVDTNLFRAIEQAEEKHQIVFFKLDPKKLAELGSKLNHLGGVLVVADADSSGRLSQFALDLLSRHQTPFATQYDLVLLHDDKTTLPHGTMNWLGQANFTLHHHLRMNDDLGYQRIIRFMKGTAYGLVLGGGGSKGWVGLGAIKALLDAGIPIDAIGGTSVGAMVGACYITAQDYDATYLSFKKIIDSLHNPFSWRNLTWPLISIFSMQKATLCAKDLFSNKQIEDMWLPFFSIACNLSTGKETVHRQGSLWKKIRATSSLPGIAPPLVLKGELYVDGGLMNNLPVDCMRAMLGEDSTIIAISLMGKTDKIIHYNFPPALPFRVGLLKKLGLGYKDYTFPPFFNTFLQSLLIGSSTKEKINQLASDILICPDLSPFRSLEIDENKIQPMIEIGYTEMQEALKSFKFKDCT